MNQLSIEKAAVPTLENNAWIGNSPMIELTKHRLQSMASSTLPVLIYGQTGTGKLIAARMLHHHDEVGHPPFITLCCKQREKGNLLQRMKEGLSNAEGGSLFIRNVDVLTDSEASLLQAFLVQSKVIESQGVRLIVSSDVKPVTTELIKAKHHFIDWLHHRCLTIELPTLMSRREDLESLVKAYQQQDLITADLRLQPSALEVLKHYAWPGNVKQLTDCLNVLAVQASSSIISQRMLLGYFPDMADNITGEFGDTAQREPIKTSVNNAIHQYAKINNVEGKAAFMTLSDVRHRDNNEPIDNGHGLNFQHDSAQHDSAQNNNIQHNSVQNSTIQGDNNHDAISATVARHPALDRAVVYLYNNFRHPINMEELAGQACVSPSHLSYLFKHYLGSSFKQTLLLLRIVEAMKLLVENPTRQVTQVCDDVGFSDLSFFVRKFKKIVGMSPGVYRDQYGQIKASRELLVVEEVLTMPMLQSFGSH